MWLLFFCGKSLPGFTEQLEQFSIRRLLVALLQLLTVSAGIEDVGVPRTLWSIGVLLIFIALLSLGSLFLWLLLDWGRVLNSGKKRCAN